MPSDRSFLEGPLAWLSRARGSLVLAKQTKPEGAFWEDQCYLAQQAVEKALKALYQYKGLLFRYTHDLEELGTGLETHGISIPQTVKDAVVLTRYAVETRYPGPIEVVTEEEYQDAIRLAEAVVDWVGNLIKSEMDAT